MIQSLIPIIGVIIALLAFPVYMMFIKPTYTYGQFLEKSAYCSIFFFKRRAIKVLNSCLNIPLISTERANILREIALLYFSINEYNKATEYFDEAINILSDEKTAIRYDKKWDITLRAYLLDGKKERAVEIIKELLERQKDDPRFKRVEKFLDGIQ